MKKSFLALSAIIILAAFAGCGNNNQATPSASPAATTAQLSVSDYFVYTPDQEYFYKGEGNEFATYNVFVDYINGNRVQIRKSDGGTMSIEVLENKDGEIRRLVRRGEIYYRQNFTNIEKTDGEVLLKEPIVKGSSWAVTDGTRTITSIDMTLSTTLGNLSTIEVTTTGKTGTTVDYYAKGYGLVKTVFKADGGDISSTLESVKNGIEFSQTVQLFYPNINNGKIYYTTKQISFNTNEDPKDLIANELKKAPSSLVGKLIGENTTIQSLKVEGNPSLDYPAGIIPPDYRVAVDFSKDLVTGMNAGSEAESMILQCITNTLGTYYQVNRVYITIDGEPYSSGHIQMNQNETFRVNTKGAIQLK